MIGALWALLSLDVTERLVARGIRSAGAASLTIIGATATSPIVVTTSAPHGVTYPLHAVVAGVVGLAGVNGTWELRRVDDTRLSLATYSPSGVPVPSAGTGAYASGGTITGALDGGCIRIGRKWRSVNGGPIRITVAPLGSSSPFALEPYGGEVAALVSLPSTLTQQPAEDHLRAQAPQILTDRHRFQVYFYGADNPPDPDFGDFDITTAIRDQLLATMFRLMPGTWEVLGGKWESQDEHSPTWGSRGQEYSAVIEIRQPVMEEPLSFVQSGVSARITVNLVNAPGSDAIIIDTPPVS
jgi:hypothetical protein